MLTHIYFFWTGNGKGKSVSYYHRMESVLSAMMLYKYHTTTIKEYPYYEMCSYYEDMLKAIACIYVATVKHALQEDINVYDMRKALDNWKAVQNMLCNPSSTKRKLITGIEKILHKPWLVSGNIILTSLDICYDICNFSQKNVVLFK